MNGQSTKGYILFLVLIFSGIISALAMVALQTSILQINMFNHHRDYVRTQQQLEQQLNDLQHQIPNNAEFLQFVPNTLHFQEPNGTNFYRIHANRLYATVAQPVQQEPKFSDSSLARLANGQWVKLKLSFNFPLAELWILEAASETVIHRIKLRLTENPRYPNPIVVDSRQQGIVDKIYLVGLREIQEIIIDRKPVILWQLSPLKLEGINIIEQFIVSRYLYLRSSDHLLAFEGEKRVFSIQQAGTVQLVQNLLVFNEDQHIFLTNKHIFLYDALNGKFIGKNTDESVNTRVAFYFS